MSISPTPPNSDSDRYSSFLRMLAKIQKMTRDPVWIHSREPWLYSSLCKCINTSQIYSSAIETLDKVLPVLRGHRNIRRWKALVTDSIVMAMSMSMTRLKAAMFVRFGEFMIDEGDHAGAKDAADIAQANVEESDDIEIQLRCYVLTLKTQPQRAMAELRKPLVYRALQLAKRLDKNDPTRASLYQTLADVYAFKQKTRASNHYARTAYCIWRRTNNLRGRIECAIISATNARYERRYERVETLFRMIEQSVSSTNTLLSHAMLLYSRGCCELEQNQLENAIDSYQQACVKFEHLLVDHMVANCHHSMALSYASMRQVSKAKRHLVMSRSLWRKAVSPYRLSEILIAQSYLARMSRNPIGAMILLARTSAQIEQIKDADLRQILESSIALQAKYILDDWDNQTLDQ